MRLVATGVAVCLLTLGLVACGGEDATGPPRPEDAQKGERVDVDAFLAVLDQSFDDASAKVEFEVGGQAALQGRGVVRYTADGMEVDIRIRDWQVAGGQVSLRTVDGATYMKVPESRGLWVDISGGDAGAADALMAEADPRSQIDDLRDDITEVRFTGEDTVAGAPARRYQVVTESEAPAVEGSAGPTITEYWFDEDGSVVRRFVDLGAEGTADFTWSGWGEPADISPPPDDETISLEELERLRRQ